MILQVADEIPFYGYRKIALQMKKLFGVGTSFKRIYRLCQELGIRAVRLPIPTSTPHTAHAIYPYLLRNKEITYANQVWQTDITYLRFPQGTIYLAAIIDVYSRKVLAWNISNTMDVLLVLLPLTWALERYGMPEIINTDQGSQYTSEDWICMIEDLGVRVSMNGKKRSIDNIYIERWWRTFKYEDYYLNQYSSVPELRKGIGEYVSFYNQERFHQALDYHCPDEVFFGTEELELVA
jgi:putative transposase